jgi:hypothetical protein
MNSSEDDDKRTKLKVTRQVKSAILIFMSIGKKLWRVRKGQNQNQREYLGNLKDFQ